MLAEKRQNGNWKKYAYLYNKNKNMDFMCSCGKIYTSYPALYLHCQRKHGKKISAELVKQECINAQLGKAETHRYVLDQDLGELKTDEVSQRMEVISSIFKGYISELDAQEKDKASEISRFPINLWRIKVLRKFMEFLFIQIRESKDKQISQILHDLPYSFNCYALNLEKELNNPEQYSVCCSIIFNFGNWLKIKGYTDLITILNKQDTEQGSFEN